MTQEEKQLLLKDLAARVPYGVMVSVQGGEFDSYKYPYLLTAVSKFGLDSFCKVYHPIYTPFNGIPNVENIKPYLRPIHKLTKEELEELEFLTDSDYVDYCNEHHIDYRNLIEKGLALEAPKDMYKLE